MLTILQAFRMKDKCTHNKPKAMVEAIESQFLEPFWILRLSQNCLISRFQAVFDRVSPWRHPPFLHWRDGFMGCWEKNVSSINGFHCGAVFISFAYTTLLKLMVNQASSL